MTYYLGQFISCPSFHATSGREERSRSVPVVSRRYTTKSSSVEDFHLTIIQKQEHKSLA